jgi:hypothetical protein
LRGTPQQSQKSFSNLGDSFYSNGMRIEQGLLNKREIDSESKEDEQGSNLLYGDSETSENNNYESQNLKKSKRADAEDDVNLDIDS